MTALPPLRTGSCLIGARRYPAIVGQMQGKTREMFVCGLHVDHFFGTLPPAELWQLQRGRAASPLAFAAVLLAAPTAAQDKPYPAKNAAFTAAQLERWYRPPETEEGVPGLIAVRGADPEEYAPADQALPGARPARRPRRSQRQRRPLMPRPARPVRGHPQRRRPPAAPPATEPPRPAAEGFEAEEEIAPGQFYARKKPKFAPP